MNFPGSLFSGGASAGESVAGVFLAALLAFAALKLLRAVRARLSAVPARDRGPDPWAATDDATGDLSVSAETRAEARDAVAGFDRRAFLRGAERFFTRFHDSWDHRDMEDLAALTSPAVFREMRVQADADRTPSATEILLVGAGLVAAGREGENEVAAVFFDALVRESKESETPAQVRELWHFIRPAGSGGPWRLDGVQQVS